MNDTKLIMWMNNIEEQEFFLSHLKKEHTVLEWGSCSSTKEIAKRVTEVISIENNKSWYNKVKLENPDNAKLYFISANKEPSPEYDDGTFDDFKDYVLFPSSLNKKYDIIFIDGRARVECFKIAKQLLKPKGLIFIHDYKHPEKQYRRFEYEVIENDEDIINIEGEFTMYKFEMK